MTRTTRWIGALLFVALTAGPVGAEPVAKPDTVDAHLALGVKLYGEGAIDESIVELERAYAIEPNANVCYALGQARRRKGDCKAAIELYRCAVEKAPDEPFARAANYQIGRCVVSAPSEAHEPAAVAAAPIPERVKIAWHRDVAGGVLLGVGLGAIAAGAGLLGHAEVLARASQDDLESYRAAGAAGGERIAGAVVLSAGALSVIGAIVRYARVARR